MSEQLKNIASKLSYFSQLENGILHGDLTLDDIEALGIKTSQSYFLKMSGTFELLGKRYVFRKTYPNTLSCNLALRAEINKRLSSIKDALTKLGRIQRNKRTVTEENRLLRQRNQDLKKRNETLASQLVVKSSELERVKRDLEHYRSRCDELARQLGERGGAGGLRLV